MGQIAEELLLLLLDNASACPVLESRTRARVLTAAVLLDLAHDFRIRPTVDDEPVPAGQLVTMPAPGPPDPLGAPALQLLSRQPLRPVDAIAKLSRTVPGAVLDHLVNTGQLVAVSNRKGLRRSWSWPLTDRTRVSAARAALLSALFDGQRPAPATAAIISLLYTVDGFGALLSLSERGRGWVRNRAGDIASGSWVTATEPELPELNLALTMAAVRPALG